MPEAQFTIEHDFMGGGRRVGEKMVLSLEYRSQIHTREIAEKVDKWANGCVVKQEIINTNVEN